MNFIVISKTFDYFVNPQTYLLTTTMDPVIIVQEQCHPRRTTMDFLPLQALGLAHQMRAPMEECMEGQDSVQPAPHLNS